MAVSSREAAVAALHAAISTALASRSPAPQVLRGETVPQRIAPGGLVMIQDGETVEETAILSPLRWQVRHVAEIVVAAPGASPEARAALLDALLVDVADAIAADRTLGGAVEWAQPESPSFDDLEFEGAAAVRAASIPVSLWFTTGETPLS
ncbi:MULTISPECIES: hypothetical protein [Elioraea]|jgi:hypothetical protein|uniref:hypothetical protein n=1 Tax=Elioraea TaxID=457933 RepID=UPI00037BC9B5|nr:MULTISPECIES: hypothetical protein [Elioraea]